MRLITDWVKTTLIIAAIIFGWLLISAISQGLFLLMTLGAAIATYRIYQSLFGKSQDNDSLLQPEIHQRDIE